MKTAFPENPSYYKSRIFKLTNIIKFVGSS